jgi:hypothetical protein
MVFALAGDSTMTSDLDNLFFRLNDLEANTDWRVRTNKLLAIGSWLLPFWRWHHVLAPAAFEFAGLSRVANNDASILRILVSS